MFSRDGSLQPSGYADARCIDAVIVSKAGVHCKEVDGGGHMTLDNAGYETWHEGGNANQSRQVYSGSPQNDISFELNQLLCKPPVRDRFEALQRHSVPLTPPPHTEPTRKHPTGDLWSR